MQLNEILTSVTLSVTKWELCYVSPSPSGTIKQILSQQQLKAELALLQLLEYFI